MKGGDEKLMKLHRQWEAKTLEIEAFVARRLGMGDLKDLAPTEYQHLKTHVEKLLEIWEEVEEEGSFSAEDDKPFFKLARERFDLEQQIDEISKT